MRLLVIALLISTLAGCEVVQLLTPSDPCSKLFTETYFQMDCRAEQGIQLEADRIIAAAKTMKIGDSAGKARLQARLNKLKELRGQKRMATTLFSKGKEGDAETQLGLLVIALEAIK